MRERDVRRLDGEGTESVGEPEGLLRCEPALRLRRERRRPEAEVALAALLQALAQPLRGELHAPVLGEPARELFGRLFRLELGQLGVLLGEQLPRLQLQQSGDEDEELATGVEVELFPLRETPDEGDDDVRDVDLGRADRVLEEQGQEEVEGALECVEVQLEVADGAGHAVDPSPQVGRGASAPPSSALPVARAPRGGARSVCRPPPGRRRGAG